MPRLRLTYNNYLYSNQRQIDAYHIHGTLKSKRLHTNMTSNISNFVSVVFPIYDEEDNIELLYDQVTKALEQSDSAYELIFVDNGSTDRSLELIKGLSREDTAVKYLSLSRNFGHQGALVAGMAYSSGSAVITMDGDLQHPPSLIPKMITKWKQGYDVVVTTKKLVRSAGVKTLQVRLFYKILSALSGLKLSFGQSDFRLLDRIVVNALMKIPEYRKFLRGTVEWMGFNQTSIEYDVGLRLNGSSKFSYKSMVSFALDGILAFSNLPLRWFLAIGTAIAMTSLIYTAVVIVIGFMSLFGLGVKLPPGWATLAATVAFFGGVQLIAIGVLGEYLGRTYEQTKGRPVYIVRESSYTAQDNYSTNG